MPSQTDEFRFFAKPLPNVFGDSAKHFYNLWIKESPGMALDLLTSSLKLASATVWAEFLYGISGRLQSYKLPTRN